ncbi:hypothetical protein HZU77_014810 [Neisseriaceae bacterium TC5R-5]|nr:hypothetical protein [Neisseriaceae bacterium TC5R-5]
MIFRFILFFIKKLLIKTLLCLLVFLVSVSLSILVIPFALWPIVGHLLWPPDTYLMLKALKMAVFAGVISGLGFSLLDAYHFLKGYR